MTRIAFRLLPLWCACALAACGGGGANGGGSSGGGAQAGPSSIVAIQVVGAPVKVFDHARDQQEPWNLPDAQVSAWREADGTVNLMLPSSEAYRMRGPDFEHLSIDPHKIYSSSQSANQSAEDAQNYAHWIMGPYSGDGVRFYSVSHSEWYACLLNGDCQQTAADGNSAQLDGWVATVNSLSSVDGGAHWQLNEVNGTHTVASPGYHWTGTAAAANRIYLHAFNASGLFQPTRLVQEGGYYYCVALYTHRDFSQIKPSANQFTAPVDQTGFVLLRTADFSKPDGRQAWAGGTTYDAVASGHYASFLPMQNGQALDAAPPQLIHDTVTGQFILIHTLYGGQNAVNYMTTASLAAPVWSESHAIEGTAGLITDPAAPPWACRGSTTPITRPSSTRRHRASISNSRRGIPCCSGARSPANTAVTSRQEICTGFS